MLDIGVNDFWDYTARKCRIASLRRNIRSKTSDPVERARREAKWIKSEIELINEHGNEYYHLEVLALWERAMKMYPEHITEQDKPSLLVL